MSWLSGKPRRVLSLHWPENDPIIQRAPEHSWGMYSVLDDQILCAFTVPQPNGRSSVVYLAKIYEAIASGRTAAIFVKIAELPDAVHRVALLPDRVGFVSLQYIERILSITLRIHNWDGAIVKEKTVHAAAAYGDIIVGRHALAVCISSGERAPSEMFLQGSPTVYHRVDAYSGSDPPASRDLTGDQIVVWGVDSDTVANVRIPQDEDAPLTHQASFQFVDHRYCALGGQVRSSFGTPSAHLKSFHINNPNEFTRTFTHGQNFEAENDIGVIAKPGSSGGNAILANYHHEGSRLTVVDNKLLTGDIDSEPSSEDPSGLHTFWDHPGFARTIEGTINEFLPSISDNRLLVACTIEDDSEERRKFAIKAEHEMYSKVLFLYDFDQARCRELCNLTVEGRVSLESKLMEENTNAQVRVVERNFYVSVEGEEDREWPPRSQPPQEWMAHLDKLYNKAVSRKEGVLEFDEAPDAQKRNPRILFARSVVWLPQNYDTRVIQLDHLALTTSGIMHVPLPGKTGRFFCFDD